MRYRQILFLAALALVAAACASHGSTVRFSVVGGDEPLTVYVQKPFGSVAPGYSFYTDTLELRPGEPVRLEIPLKGISSLRLSHSGRLEQLLLEPGKAYEIEFDYSDPANSRMSIDDPVVQLYSELAGSRDPYRYEFIRDYSAAPLDTVAQRMVENFEALAAADRERYAGLDMSRPMREAVYGEIELHRAGVLAKVFARNYNRQLQGGAPMYEGYAEAWDGLYERLPISAEYAPLAGWPNYVNEYLSWYLLYKGHIDMGSITSQGEWWQRQYELIGELFDDPQTREMVMATTLLYDSANNKNRDEALLGPIEKFLTDYPSSPFAPTVSSFAEDIRAYHRKLAEGGSADIRFVENYELIPTLGEVLERFRGKPVFVDFWFSTCGPCHAEFRKSGPLKTFLKENDIETLYISIDPPELEKEWRDAIKFYDLAGWHVRTGKSLRTDMADNYGITMFPRYMLADSDGNIVIRDAKAPSDGEALFTQIREALKP